MTTQFPLLFFDFVEALLGVGKLRSLAPSNLIQLVTFFLQLIGQLAEAGGDNSAEIGTGLAASDIDGPRTSQLSP